MFARSILFDLAVSSFAIILVRFLNPMFGWLSHVLAQTQFPQNQQNSHKNGPIHKATFSTQNLNSVDPSSASEVLVASVASNQGWFILPGKIRHFG